MLNCARFASRCRAHLFFVRSVRLFVPQLLPDPPGPADALLRFPNLHRLLARARLQRTPADHSQAVLCAEFGVRVQGDDWPVAPLTLLADGHVPGADFWLRADPVHLQARQSDLVLVDSDRLGISATEAAALIESLNLHFSEEGLSFLAPAAQRWYIRVSQPARLRTIPPDQAAGRSIASLLPRGDDALAWHRRANEVQMLLHEHPVNAAREAAGTPPINSVWFWGGGRLPPSVAAEDAQVWALDPLARGLALNARRALHAPPGGAQAWLAQAADGRHLVLPDLFEGAQQHAAWDQRTAHFDAVWLAPLLQALSRGALRELALITHHAGSALRFMLSRADLWKLWRRNYSLAHA